MVLHGQVGQALHGERLDDAALILKIASKNRRNHHAVPPRQLQARKDLSQMPFQLLLFRFSGQLDELSFEGAEPLRIRHGQFLCCIGGTHADQLVRMLHAVNQSRKECRCSPYKPDHLIGTTDRAPIPAPEFIQDDSVCAHRKTELQLSAIRLIESHWPETSVTFGTNLDKASTCSRRSPERRP